MPRLVFTICLLSVFALSIGCAEPTPPAAAQAEPTTEPLAGAAAGGAQMADSAAPSGVPATTPPVATPAAVPEPFDTQQFLADRTPMGANGASLYREGLSKISSDFGRRESRELERRIGELADLQKLQSGQVDAAEVRRLLASAEEGLALIDRAQQIPTCVFETDISIDALLPHAHAARGLGRLGLLQLYLAKVDGDPQLAETAVRRTLRLSQDLQTRGPLVSQLVSIALDGTITEGIRELTLSMPQLTPERCDTLIRLLAEHDEKSTQRAAEGLKMEYLVFLHTLDEVTTGKRPLNEALALSDAGEINLPANFVVQTELERNAAKRLFALAIAEAEQPYRQHMEAQRFAQELHTLKNTSQAAVAEFSRTGQLNAPLLALLLIPGVDPAIDAAARARAQLAGTQLLLALRRYALAHGNLPQTLDEAVADTPLGNVPIDPYSGEPMRLAVINNVPTVYSTGKDLRDDGGRIDWQYGQQPGDYLFPLPSP